ERSPRLIVAPLRGSADPGRATSECSQLWGVGRAERARGPSVDRGPPPWLCGLVTRFLSASQLGGSGVLGAAPSAERGCPPWLCGLVTRYLGVSQLCGGAGGGAGGAESG